MVEGMYKYSQYFYFCEHFVYGKQNWVRFPSGATRAEGILQLVHSDVFGPVSVPSLGKYMYYVSFIDDFSRNTWIYFLRKKYEVFDRFKEFKAPMWRIKQRKELRCRGQIMAESSARMNSNNSVRSVVYQGIRLLHIHLRKMDFQKG
jgi:hypothetical protein